MIEWIETGQAEDDGTGDTLRDAFEKINRNFEELAFSMARRAPMDQSDSTVWPAEFVPRYVEKGAPTRNPQRLGALWVDAENGEVYIARGTTSVEDWRKVLFAGDA